MQVEPNVTNLYYNREEGYKIEFGRKKVIYASKAIAIEDTDIETPYYNLFFYNKGLQHHV